MKNWFKKYILIPPPMGLFAYFYLFFMIPMLYTSWSYPEPLRFLYFLLVLSYLYFYRQGYFDAYQNSQNLFVQLILATIVAIPSGYISIFIYTGWQFPFWQIKESLFRKYLNIYYAFVLIASLFALLLVNFQIQFEWGWLFFGLFVVLVSPFFARYLYSYQHKINDLNLNRQRLETIIRQGERERIARDLHDNLGQSYSMIALKAELASKLLQKDPVKAQKELQEIAQTSRDHLNLVRNIVGNLHETTIASVLVENQNQLGQAEIILITKDEEISRNWPLEIQYIMGAILKEAFNNVVRHSQAQKVEVNFGQGNTYWMNIHDNGIGLSASFEPSFGIKGMISRIEKAQGKLFISNNKGCLLKVELPIKEGERD